MYQSASGENEVILDYFAMTGNQEHFKWRFPRPVASEIALSLARGYLEEVADFQGSVTIGFLEGNLQFQISANNGGFADEIQIYGLSRLPVSILASLEGENLSKLIAGSSIINEIIGDRPIRGCWYDEEVDCHMVLVEGTSKGWWFMR